MGEGRPIVDFPQSAGYTDYRRLVEELTREQEGVRQISQHPGSRRTRG